MFVYIIDVFLILSVLAHHHTCTYVSYNEQVIKFCT